MKRLTVFLVAMLMATAAVAGGRGGHNWNQGPNNGGRHWQGNHNNGWAVAGAFAAGAMVGSWGAWGGPQFVAPMPVVPVWPQPFVQHWGPVHPPQPIVVCVQSGNSPFFQQGNCFTRWVQ